jgi:hypothetical protein
MIFFFSILFAFCFFHFICFSISFIFLCLHFVCLFHFVCFSLFTFRLLISFHSLFNFTYSSLFTFCFFFFSFCLSYQFDRLTRIKILSLFSSNNVFTRKILPNCCSSCPRSSVVPTRKSPSSKPKSSPVMLSSVL